MSVKCLVCGRSLTNPTSVMLGIGPICRGRGYYTRIITRFGNALGIPFERWEYLNAPCYTCSHFCFPTKEEVVDDYYSIEYKQHIYTSASLTDIIGWCNVLNKFVDGNQIRKNTACKNCHFKYSKRKLPKQKKLIQDTFDFPPN